jgi:vitamin B12 transport system substrate-binding protein
MTLKLKVFCYVALSLVMLGLMRHDASAQGEQGTDASFTDMRIITMAPHLSELVYLLEQEAYLVAVSDYSDYPLDARLLPSVVSYQGANIAAILRLKPTHILAWQGGNKASDIAKLKASGIKVYVSPIAGLSSLVDEIKNIADFLHQSTLGERKAVQLEQSIQGLQARYGDQSKSVIYLIGLQPLIALGNDPWINDLLKLCGLNNVLQNTLTPYPQISMAQALRHQPDLVIVGGKQALQDIWPDAALNANIKLLQGNPDKLHRFTPRAIDEMNVLCELAHSAL